MLPTQSIFSHRCLNVAPALTNDQVVSKIYKCLVCK